MRWSCVLRRWETFPLQTEAGSSPEPIRFLCATKNRALSGSVSENRDAVGPHDNLHPSRWVASLPFLCFQLPPCILQQGGRPAIRGGSAASLIQIVGPCGAGVHAHRSSSKQKGGGGGVIRRPPRRTVPPCRGRRPFPASPRRPRCPAVPRRRSCCFSG